MGESGWAMKNDEEIASLIQADKIELFGVLMERYEGKMKRYAAKFISNQEDINDVVQDVFLKAYENIQSFDVKRRFSPWLYRIAHNELVNSLRKREKRKVLPLLDLDTFVPHNVKQDNPEQEVEKGEIKKFVQEGLEKLEFKYREPVFLYYFEELSYKEIADIMEIPVSTVGIRIKRAKEKMKIFMNKKLNNNL